MKCNLLRINMTSHFNETEKRTVYIQKVPCSNNGVEHDTIFNHIKSVCTIFKPNSYKLSLPTFCYLF